MHIHIHHHYHYDDDLLQQIRDLIMPTLDDLKAKADTIIAKITSDTDLDNAVATVVNNQNATIADLKSQLAAAGTDPVKLAKCDSIYSAEWTKRCSAICTNPSVTAQEETPRMKCLREAQEAHLKCLSTAKTPAQKKACNDALAAAIQACPPPDPNGQH